MKKYILLLLSFPLFICACTDQHTYRSTLVALDSLCNTYPDSALSELHQLTDSIGLFSTRDKMYWSLLCTKAQDKAFIPHVSDSIMREVVAYYDKNGSVCEQAEAHYYLASIYRDLHDSPRSVIEFQRALNLLDDNNINNTQLSINCCSQLSGLYNTQYQFEEALKIAKRGVEIGEKYNALTPTLLADVAYCYMRMNDTIAAANYYQSAVQLIMENNIEKMYTAAIVSEAMSVFSLYRMEQKADECYNWLSHLSYMPHQINYYGNMTNYFLYKGMIDSAIVYNQKRYSFQYPSIFSKQEAARSLMNIYYHLGQLDSASYYGQLYAAASDSVDNFLKIEQTRNARNEYQYQRDMEAEAKAYQEASVARMRLVLFVGFAAISTLAGILYHVNRKRVMAQKLLEKEGIIQEQRHTLLQKDETLNETKQRLEKRQAQNERLTQMMLAAGSERMNDDVIGLFKAAAKGKRVDITEETWQQLMAALDREYPDFCSRIMERWPTIGNNALHIACLHKLGMSNAEAFTVLGIPRSTFYRLAHQVDEQLGE